MPPEGLDDLLNMSVALDFQDPFDEEKNAKFLSRLPVPLEDYDNCHVVSGYVPDMKDGKAVALGMCRGIKFKMARHLGTLMC